MVYRGIIHCHSKHSFDSMTSLESFLKLARKEKLDFIILADHNTIEGSIELHKLAIARNIKLEVPIAAEYATDSGDMIAAFIEHEIESRNIDEFISETKKQDGIILFPHPYYGHDNVDDIAKQVDLIEIYNGHIQQNLNEKAALLAKKTNKPGFFASDAHTAASLSGVIVEVESHGNLKESLLAGNIQVVRMSVTGHRDMLISQFVKALKRRDPMLFIYLCLRPIWRLFKLLFSRNRKHRKTI